MVKTYVLSLDFQMCQSHKDVIGGGPGDEQMWIDTDGTPYAYYKKSSLIQKFIEQTSTDQPESPLDKWVY